MSFNFYCSTCHQQRGISKTCPECNDDFLFEDDEELGEFE